MKGIQQRQHSKTILSSQQQDEDDRQQQYNESSIEQQLSAVLVEKLRLEEMLEFMKDESDKNIEEIAVQKKRADVIEQALKEAQIEMNISSSQGQAFHAQTKRMEDQLRTSNFNFVSVQKKLAGFEKDNKDLQDKLQTMDLEKKKISVKWAAASQRGRDEDKLKLRLRELEIELGERKLESEDYKKKYVQVNTELRVYKEGELSYKDVVESRFKEVRERYIEEQRQKEELLKQNSLLVQQLEEFSSQFGDQINFNPGRKQQEGEKKQDSDRENEDEVEENEFVNLERTQSRKEQLSQQGKLIRGGDTKKRQTDRKANYSSSSKGKNLNNLRNLEEQREQELLEIQSQLEEQKILVRTLESELQFKKSEFEGEISKLSQEKEELSEALCVLAQQSPVCSSDKSSEFSDFKQLSSAFLLIKDEQIRKVVEIKVREHFEVLLQQAHQQQLKQQQQQQQHIQSTCVCRECGKRVSDRSIEKQLSDLQILYDRLLSKHSALLNQQSKPNNMNSLTLIKKSQNASVSEEEKAQEEKAQPLADQAYFYSQGRTEEINGTLRNSKAVTGETIVDSIFREDEGKAGEINDSKFERSGNNSALIQTILRNGFTLKDQLTEGSQKMLSSLLGKLTDSQNLSGHFTSSRKYLNPQNNSFKIQDYNSNNNNPTNKSFRSGLPLHTLERSLLRRNKSKENHPIPNGQQQQHSFYNSSSSYSIQGKSSGNNSGNHSTNGSTSYSEIYASQQASHLKNSNYQTLSKLQQPDYQKEEEEQGNYLNNQSSGKLLNRSVDGINSISSHQAHSSKPKKTSFYQDNQRNNKNSVSAQFGKHSNFIHEDYQDYYQNNDLDSCNSNKNMPSFGGHSNYLFQAENQDHSKEEFTSADLQDEFEQ